MKLAVMDADVDPVQHHVSGFYTTMLMESLLDRMSSDAVADVLLRAGEVRSVADLSQSSSWSSHDQFRRLLEEAKVAVGHESG